MQGTHTSTREVGDHTVLQRTDRGDVTRGAAEHALGFGAHCLDRFLAIVEADCND
jgi:hypothetical protein